MMRPACGGEASHNLTLRLEQFEHAWRGGMPPDIGQFLRDTPATEDDERPRFLVELVLVDMEYRWRGVAAGATIPRGLAAATESSFPERPLLEDYAQRLPELAPAASLSSELIEGEYRVRCRWGTAPEHAEYLDRFAERRETLPAALSAIDRELSQEADTQNTVGVDTWRGCADAAPAASPGALGDYELLEEIARGGMGIVYKARQKKLNRIVALKMILSGQHADADEVKRFLAEAQAAANLDHPRIVPIYEVNEHQGRHYFSMGYVEGQSLARRIADGPLPPRDGAGMLLKICEAVQYAHTQGIVHRDLKPGNILLDRNGEPRVTDFGLAKRVHGGSELTATGQILGTPSFMPPEQALGRLTEIGPRSDVYALGAILYALLTGQPPFRASSLPETLRQVVEREPVAPSQLNREVPRDLETICLKCLEKDPVQRYTTAHDLADECGRFLRDEPILARPVSRRARLWRWCRRNPAIAGLAASVAVVLVVGIVVSSTLAAIVGAKNVELSRANTSERLARTDAETKRQAADAAEHEARESEADTQAFSAFLVDDVLSVARPKDQRGGLGINVTVREALDHAALGIVDRFRDRPRAEAIARHDLGVTYRLIGDLEAAETQLRAAFRIRTESLGRDDEDTLKSQNSLAVLLNVRGKTAEALSLHEDCLKRQRANLGDDHASTLSSLNNVAETYLLAGDVSKALRLLKQSLEQHRAKLGDDHPETLSALNNLAAAYLKSGQFSQAVTLSAQCLKRTREAFGDNHPDTLKALNNLAAAYHISGDLLEAIPLLEASLERSRAMLGPDHPETLTSLNNLAEAYRAAGDLSKALPMTEQCLEQMRIKLGEDHPETITALNNLAIAYSEVDVLKALPLLEQCLAQRRANQGDDHPDTLASLANLAQAYKSAGAFRKALPLWEECLAQTQAKLGENHPLTLTCLDGLATAHEAAGEFSTAVPLRELCLERTRLTRGEDHPDTLSAINRLAGAYESAGEWSKAVPLFEHGLERRRATLGDDHPSTLQSMNGLALAYDASGEVQKALRLYEECLERMRTTRGEEHSDTLMLLGNLAAAHRSAGELSKALPLYEKCLAGTRAALGEDHLDTLRALNNLAVGYEAAGEWTKALPLYEQCLERLRAKLGENHPDTLTLLNNVAAVYKSAGELSKAIRLYEQCTEGRRATLGEDHPLTLSAMFNLATAYYAANQPQQAEKTLRQCLELRQRSRPEEWQTFNVQGTLGFVLLRQQRFDEAEPLLVAGYEGLAARVATVPPARRSRLTDTLEHIVELYEVWGRPAEAERWRAELLDAHRAAAGALPEGSPERAGALAQIGLKLLASKQYTLAEDVLRECLAIREEILPDDWLVFNTHSMLGSALAGQQKYAEAESLLLQGYEGLKQRHDAIPAPARFRVVEALERLVDLYTAWHKPDEAAKWQTQLDAARAAEATQNDMK